MYRFGPCPWGQITDRRSHGDGVEWVQTVGHGGIVLSRAMYSKMPRILRKLSFTKDQWFEEDCSWCAVPMAFPWMFSDHAVATARDTFMRYYPDTYRLWVAAGSPIARVDRGEVGGAA